MKRPSSSHAASVGGQEPKRVKQTSACRELGGKPSYRGGSPKKGPAAEVLRGREPLPKRDSRGRLHFPDHPEFLPNLTPAQILQSGSFGGTYFRPIDSGTTGEREEEAWKEFPAAWFKGLDIPTQVTRSWSSYDVHVNKYGVKCGGTLDMWESSGWISAIDPYGWFHWYCRFFLGRRSTDDDRQIARWSGVASAKGRFRNQLIRKCVKARTTFDDVRVSPVIRQTLLHWAYELTQADADEFIEEKKLLPLKQK
mmetsp:Transcript_3243/g.7642  ORF Transcript_3243/g.7642 Transcript_3243/m.7642 type:complete len:253 (+) Transcript_3243:38-796(+)